MSRCHDLEILTLIPLIEDELPLEYRIAHILVKLLVEFYVDLSVAADSILMLQMVLNQINEYSYCRICFIYITKKRS